MHLTWNILSKLFFKKIIFWKSSQNMTTPKEELLAKILPTFNMTTIIWILKKIHERISGIKISNMAKTFLQISVGC